MEIFGLTGIKSPCMKCTERWVNETGRCHSTCEAYKEFTIKVKEEHQQIQQERMRAIRNPIAEGKTTSQLNRMAKARKK